MHQHPSSSTWTWVIKPLVIIVATLAIIATLVGLFWPGGEGSYTVTSYRGQDADIYGRGIYRDSSLLAGAAARGTDVVTLALAVPMMLVGAMLHRRGSIRGMLLLSGALTWMLYAYGSMALGTVAYTDVFLLHVALFGSSLWALVLLLLSINLQQFGRHLEAGLPRRGLGVFLIASGIVTTVIWLIEPVAALISGELPESLGVSSTLVTYALDIAIIAPATLIIASLVLRSRPAGYLLAMPVLILEAMLAPMMIGQTIFQLQAGVEFAPAQIAIFIGGFMVLAIIAIWMLVQVFRHIDDAVIWHSIGHGRMPVAS